MRENRKKALALFLTLAMLVGVFPAAGAASVDNKAPDLRAEYTRPEGSVDVIAPEEWVTVIVELEGETTLDVDQFSAQYRSYSKGFSADSAVAGMRAGMVADQEAVQAQIAALQPDAMFRYHYTNLLNGFAAQVQYQDIEAIKALDGVLGVYLTQTYSYDYGWEEGEEEAYEIVTDLTVEEDEANSGLSLLSDQGSVDQMGLQMAWDNGYTGAGKVVAVLDSSLRYTHELFQYMDPDLVEAKPGNYKTQESLLQTITENAETINLFNSGWGSWFHQRPNDQTGFSEEIQEQIRNGEFWYNEKVPFAVDYMDGDLEVWDGDSSSHGTHVCGISAGNPGPRDPKRPVSMDNSKGVLGSAHDAQIMFFKVFSEYDDFGQESDEAVFAALDDAVTLGVNSINLSLGIPNGFTTMVTYAQAGYQKAYNRAAAAGISIAVSAGNDTRDTHTGTLVPANTTILPNSSRVGFSGSLFAPMTVASAQGTGYRYVSSTTYTTTMTAKFTPDPVETPEPEVTETPEPEVTETPEPEVTETPEPEVTEAPAPETTETPAPSVGNAAEEDEGVVIDDNQVPQAEGPETEISVPDVSLTDYNAPNLGKQLTGSYEVVDCGDASAEAIAAAGDLTGKVALVNAGTSSSYDDTLADKAKAAADAGAVAVVLASTADRNSAISSYYYDYKVPTFGLISSSVYEAMQAALAAGTVEVSFSTTGRDNVSERTYDDNGPSSFTSWGVTEALRLKPDIMAPGGSIASAGASSDTAVSIKSGTSMASPNMAGAFLVIQQYVDDNLDVFGVEPGTQEYSNLVNQLVASTARVYQPLSGNTDLYFSPRRQGAGMVNAAAAINSKVVLRSQVGYDAATGEAPRTKVELFDQLGDEFSFTFELVNYNRAARTFDVLSCLQTDATSTSGGRDVLVGSSSGRDTDAIDSAVMKVAAVKGGTLSDGGNNINRYSDDAAPAVVTVPAKGVAEITVTVTLDPDVMADYDAKFPNGMFLEGYVFFDSVKEDVNIPFMGFRGDWNQAPLFDLATAYEDVSEKTTADLDYPVYYAAAMATRLKDGSGEQEAVLGANQFTSSAWPGYPYGGSYRSTRNYFSRQRGAGLFSGDFSAISPNADGYADLAYANLLPLRNVKALCVTVTDASGKVVKVLGPEYEYFEAHSSDGNGTQTVAATYGTKYNRNMAWDGTGADGAVVPDGQYSYNVYGITEYEYLKSLGYKAADTKVLEALLSSDAAQSISMPVKVDTMGPALVAGPVGEDGQWAVKVSDAGGIQSAALYYDGALLGSVETVGKPTWEKTWDTAALNVEDFDPSKLELQVVDYAFNVASAKAGEETDTTVAVTSPANVSVREGAAAVLTVNSNAYLDDTAVYEWFQAEAADAEGVALEGAESASLSVDTATVGVSYYYCVVNGVKSNVVTVEVTPEPVYELTLPAATSVVRDGSAVLTLGGDELPEGTTYQWFKADNAEGANAQAIEGADSASYTVDTSALGTAYYYCVATTPDGDYTSNVASVEVRRPSSSGGSSGGSGSAVKPTEEVPEGGTPLTDLPDVEYTDVDKEDWSYEAVQYVSKKNLMKGTGEGLFGPNMTTTRGMIVTILYRLEGEPEAAKSDFTDVADGQWYANAIGWGAANGIVLGKGDGTFAPEEIITREQMAAILYRYAQYKKYDVTGSASLADFADGETVSSWAETEMSWAVSAKLINGKGDGVLDPQGDASRAQAAAILMRFCQAHAEAEK